MYVFIKSIGQSPRQYFFDHCGNQRLCDLLRQHEIDASKAFCGGRTVLLETVLVASLNEKLIEIR